jgi:hypothetical protein
MDGIGRHLVSSVGLPGRADWAELGTIVHLFEAGRLLEENGGSKPLAAQPV